MILDADTSKSLTRRGRLGLLAVALAALPVLPAFSQGSGEAQRDEARRAAELAAIEARVAEMQFRRMMLADRLAALETNLAQRPDDADARAMLAEVTKLAAEAEAMEADADAQRSVMERVAGGGRYGQNAAAQGSDVESRRRALRAGAEALLASGDAEGSKVLLGMLEELDAQPFKRGRNELLQAREKLSKLGYLGAAKEWKDKAWKDYGTEEWRATVETLQKLQAGGLDRTPLPWPAMAEYLNKVQGESTGPTRDALLKLYAAGAAQAASPTDGRVEQLEKKLEDLTRLVEELARNLGHQNSRGGGAR